MKNKQYDVPILMIVFKRLDNTKRVFNEIRKVKPKQLFIVADGPRNEQEKGDTEKVREYLSNNIDWKCEVHKLFREKNLGGDKSSIDGLYWFFKHVEYGIFMEDDCLACESFFNYHRELLIKYKDEEKVKAICSVNFLKDHKINSSYIFSRVFFSCWGFSTWKRAWGYNEDKLRNVSNKSLKKAFPYLFLRLKLKRQMYKVFKKGAQGWDYLFLTSNGLKGGVSIVPSVSLSENIGFDSDSTHEFNKVDKKYLKVKAKNIKFPMQHPKEIITNKRYDANINRLTIMKFFEKRVIGSFIR